MLTHKVIVQLIAATKTASGLNIASATDVNQYPKEHKISPALSSQRSRPNTMLFIPTGTTP